MFLRISVSLVKVLENSSRRVLVSGRVLNRSENVLVESSRVSKCLEEGGKASKTVRTILKEVGRTLEASYTSLEKS